MLGDRAEQDPEGRVQAVRTREGASAGQEYLECGSGGIAHETRPAVV
jgi:hypothetical protein